VTINQFNLCKNSVLQVLIIDNYDSFTYNIVALLQQIGVTNIEIRFNDGITAEQAAAYDAIILSPGPSTPSASGNLLSITKALSATHPILGICLGHQAIAEVFGGSLINLPSPFHGYQTTLQWRHPHSLFHGIDKANTPFRVGLYHSWVVDPKTLPDCLNISSVSAEGHIMSVCHQTLRVHGVQFHPESYMTPAGKDVMINFLRCV
jgi:anthranilate synthase component 2